MRNFLNLQIRSAKNCDALLFCTFFYDLRKIYSKINRIYQHINSECGDPSLHRVFFCWKVYKCFKFFIRISIPRQMIHFLSIFSSKKLFLIIGVLCQFIAICMFTGITLSHFHQARRTCHSFP